MDNLQKPQAAPLHNPPILGAHKMDLQPISTMEQIAKSTKTACHPILRLLWRLALEFDRFAFAHNKRGHESKTTANKCKN